MRTDDPNLPDLRRIAEALGERREQVVFVGGAVAGLLVTDPLADSVLPAWLLDRSTPVSSWNALFAELVR